MLVNKAYSAAGLVVLGLAGGATASPTPGAELVSAGVQLATEILKWFHVTLFDSPANAWEYSKDSRMCAIYMETTDGANCYASVTCDDGTRTYNNNHETWNVCYVGGRQYFTDPRIGDFSITFTERDGKGQGEGLTTPILQLKDVGDWKEFPVSALADLKAFKDEGCMPGFPCPDGPYICTHMTSPNRYYFEGRTRAYKCGMPKIGKGQGSTGLDSNAPTNSAGYAPGWCGLHVVQHQKPNPATDSYTLNVSLKDDNENEIGNAASGPTLSLGSKLPYTVEIQTHNVDADAVTFQYAGQSWDSNDSSRCKVGAYDGGSRQMDCGFSCA